MKAILAIMAVALFGASRAVAAGPMYAHKSGVSEEALNIDETACFGDAQKAMHDPKFAPPYTVNPLTQSTMAGSMGAAFGYGLAAGIQSGKRFNTTLYDCLTSRGYTMRRISTEDWKTIKKLPKDEQKTRMFSRRTAAEPVDPEVPRDKID